MVTVAMSQNNILQVNASFMNLFSHCCCITAAVHHESFHGFVIVCDIRVCLNRTKHITDNL